MRIFRILDADGKEWRFHKMKFEQGFPKVLSHEAFLDPSRGFLVGDCCIFGVEVFTIKSSHQREHLFLAKEPQYVWKIDKFSALEDLFLHKI